MRTVECVQGEVPVELICAPRFNYGRAPARWTAARGTRPTSSSTPPTATTTVRLFSDMRMGIEGHTAHARHTMREGEQRFCALSWTEELGGPRTFERGATRTSQRTATTGASGSPPAPTPTIRGASTCSARRSC